MNTLISSLAGETPPFIKSIQSFVESIKNTHLQPTEMIASSNIKSLFTNVLVQEALGVIHGKVLAKYSLGERIALSADQVTHLLEVCVRITYFLYKGEYYQQKVRAAMDTAVSPVVANLYM